MLALVSFDVPPIGGFIEVCRGNSCLERHVPPQVEAVGHMVQVVENLWLLRILAAPFPFLHEILVEGEAIYVRLGVAAGARVTVPIPGAADASTGLDHVDVESERVS